MWSTTTTVLLQNGSFWAGPETSNVIEQEIPEGSAPAQSDNLTSTAQSGGAANPDPRHWQMLTHLLKKALLKQPAFLTLCWKELRYG